MCKIKQINHLNKPIYFRTINNEVHFVIESKFAIYKAIRKVIPGYVILGNVEETEKRVQDYIYERETIKDYAK